MTKLEAANRFLIGWMIAMGVILSGCGGGSTATGRYAEILHGLHDAALAGSNYNAVRRAKVLPSPERAVVDAFCNFAWQIGVNHEAAKLSKHEYVVGRIRTSAKFSLQPLRAVEPAMEGLQSIIDLQSLDASLVARYAKACET